MTGLAHERPKCVVQLRPLYPHLLTLADVDGRSLDATGLVHAEVL
jgi:hypothetical protein